MIWFAWPSVLQGAGVPVGGATAGAGIDAVPEPSSLALIAGALLLFAAAQVATAVIAGRAIRFGTSK
ncbi:MAG: hypothetical protein ACRD9W_14365 [Terriglobia bacterium]